MDIYNIQIKRGMKFILAEANEATGAKAGDVVKVTSVKAMGAASDGHCNDYEVIRVSNEKFSWRVGRSDLAGKV